MDAAAGPLWARGKSMLAQSAMTVVFVPVQSIRLGRPQGCTAVLRPTGDNPMAKTFKSATETKLSGKPERWNG